MFSIRERVRPSGGRKSKFSYFRQGFIVALVSVLIFGMGVIVGRGQLTFDGQQTISRNRDSKLPADLNYATVEAVYDALRANYDGELKEDVLLDGLKSG